MESTRTSQLVGLSIPLTFHGQLILGSGSPRRKELLAVLGIPFSIRVADSPEIAPTDLTDVDTVSYVAKGKALVLAPGLAKGEVLLTADTEVWMDGIRYGKPKDASDAKAMLGRLCGHQHRVITALWATDGITWKHAEAVAQVTLADMGQDWIDYYVDHHMPLDKAGGYGAQEWFGHLGIANMDGTFDNVKGLPLPEVLAVLRPWLHTTD